MTSPADGSDKEETLLSLSERERRGAFVLIAVLIFAHLANPKLAIDAILLVLIASALFINYFDLDGLAWGGVRARRRVLQSLQKEIADGRRSASAPTVSPPPAAAHAARQPESEDSGDATSESAESLTAMLMPPVQPLERLLWSFEQIRIELTVLVGNSGRMPPRDNMRVLNTLVLRRIALKAGFIDQGIYRAIEEVTKARNEIVHGAAPLSLARDAADLGLETVQRLRSVKRNYIRVARADVSLYADASLTTQLPVKGVILATVDELGVALSEAAAPTTLQYARGQFVSWEWDSAKGINSEAWIRHPQSGAPFQVFVESLHFVGRAYPDEWGLAYRLPRPDAGLGPEQSA